MMGVRIKRIEAIPWLDPYHEDTGQLTTTQLWINSSDCICGVRQQMEVLGVPPDEYHNRIITYSLEGYPETKVLREYLEGEYAQGLLTQICDGHSIEWDGHNWVGRLTAEARDALDKLGSDLDGAGIAWEVCEFLEWFVDYPDELAENTTDQEIEELAARYEALADQDAVVINGDLVELFLEYRENLRSDRGDEQLFREG